MLGEKARGTSPATMKSPIVTDEKPIPKAAASKPAAAKKAAAPKKATHEGAAKKTTKKTEKKA